jgi:segregation and condensation protein B
MTELPIETSTKIVSDEEIARVIEAVLLVADTPLEPVSVAATLGFPTEAVERALTHLKHEYVNRGAGIELREVAGGWRLYTAADVAPWVERYVRDGQVARLTQASLETLAVIAYKQPVSRARISAIRGVNIDGVVKTLESRGLIEIRETDPESGALLYGTTALFLEKLGLAKLEELPAIADHLPDLQTALEIQETL